MQELFKRFDKILEEHKPDDKDPIIISAGDLRAILTEAKRAPSPWKSKIIPLDHQ